MQENRNASRGDCPCSLLSGQGAPNSSTARATNSLTAELLHTRGWAPRRNPANLSEGIFSAAAIVVEPRSRTRIRVYYSKCTRTRPNDTRTVNCDIWSALTDDGFRFRNHRETRSHQCERPDLPVGCGDERGSVWPPARQEKPGSIVVRADWFDSGCGVCDGP